MAKCNSCLHFDVCEKYHATVDFDVDDGVCLHYEKKVVRCNDCKHYGSISGICYVDRKLGQTLPPIRVKHSDFCSYGERKDDA